MYATKQREILGDFLKKNSDKLLTVAMIYQGVRDSGISKSAVYRNIAALEKEKLVQRCSVEGKNEAYFRYLGGEACRNHLHITCTKCGKTVHLQENVSGKIAELINGTSDFMTDIGETTIYGTCDKCR